MAVTYPTTGELLSPGAPGYISALNLMGYQFGEGTPDFVFAGMPAVYALAPIPIPPGEPPGQPPGQPPAEKPRGFLDRAGDLVFGVTGPTLSGIIDPIGDIKDRIVQAIGKGLGAAFDAVTSVVRRITDVVADLAQATLPTIQELATAVASTATGALNFLADNLTDMGDFGRTLASAMLDPLFDFADYITKRMGDFLNAFVQLLSAIAEGVRDRLTGSAEFERTI